MNASEVTTGIVFQGKSGLIVLSEFPGHALCPYN